MADRRREVTRRRLRNQYLSAPTLTRPADLVTRLGAVQAQDYRGAKWGLAQSLRGATEAAIDKAFDEGRILRTHVLRPTWHLVAPADIRWMLRLTAPRIGAGMAPYCRKLGLDAAVFRRSNKALAAVLERGPQQRDALRRALQQARVPVDGLRFTFLLLRAELDEVICSGPRAGRQLTHALMDERAPRARLLSRDESLAELATRYFTTRGPATVRDFIWWSGLRTADAKAAIDMAGRTLTREVIDGETCWASSTEPPVTRTEVGAFLLPLYDEYLIAYKDRSAAFDAAVPPVSADSYGQSGAPLLVDGRVAGWWRRTLQKGVVTIRVTSGAAFGRTARAAVTAAAARYGEFLQAKVRLE